jgi:hypothetical protein
MQRFSSPFHGLGFLVVSSCWTSMLDQHAARASLQILFKHGLLKHGPLVALLCSARLLRQERVSGRGLARRCRPHRRSQRQACSAAGLDLDGS